jgi:hypothetical protein
MRHPSGRLSNKARLPPTATPQRVAPRQIGRPHSCVDCMQAVLGEGYSSHVRHRRTGSVRPPGAEPMATPVPPPWRGSSHLHSRSRGPSCPAAPRLKLDIARRDRLGARPSPSVPAVSAPALPPFSERSGRPPRRRSIERPVGSRRCVALAFRSRGVCSRSAALAGHRDAARSPLDRARSLGRVAIALRALRSRLRPRLYPTLPNPAKPPSRSLARQGNPKRSSQTAPTKPPNPNHLTPSYPHGIGLSTV